MSIYTIIREIDRTLHCWHKIRNPPQWIINAVIKYENNMKNKNRSPYNRTIKFTGKNHFYKVRIGECRGQGIYKITYYQKRIIK